MVPGPHAGLYKNNLRIGRSAAVMRRINELAVS